MGHSIQEYRGRTALFDDVDLVIVVSFLLEELAEGNWA
jgi:hypothetical protein